MSDVKREKKRLEKEAEDLEKELKQKQNEVANKGEEEEDIWSLKTALRDLKNESDDLIMRTDKIKTQIQRVQSGRATFEVSGSRSSTVSYTHAYDSSSRATSRTTEASSRLPPARKYKTSTGRSRY